MTQLLRNNGAAVGTTGTAVTTGNSGGASGNAWNNVTAGTTGAITVDSTVPALGSFAYKFASGATADANSLFWNSTTMTDTPQTEWFDFLVYFTALPGSTWVVKEFLNGTSTAIGFLVITTAGNVRMENAASGTITTSTLALSTSKVYRLAGFVTSSATVGQTSVSIYDAPDVSLCPIETDLSAATQATGGSAINKATFGIVASETSFTAFLSTIGVSDLGPIGPRMVQAAA